MPPSIRFVVDLVRAGAHATETHAAQHRTEADAVVPNDRPG